MILNVEKRKRGRPRKHFDSTPKEKKKMGRPLKDSHGAPMWIPAELLDTVKMMINNNRQAKQQAKQS